MARYDLLAVDLDGTLLGPDRRVSRRNLAALDRARAEGLEVVVCTGRGLVESREILESIGQKDPVVLAGGSIVACPMTGRTLHRFAIAPDIVADAVTHLDPHGHAILILKDPSEAGYDYLVLAEGPGELHPVTAWWFERLGVRVRYADDLAQDEHVHHTVRLGVCAGSRALDRAMAALNGSIAQRLAMHHFPAVSEPEHELGLDHGERLHVLEIFAAEASKWSAITRLADGQGIPAARIAAIGDEINDLSMVRGAGLGIAMGNAVPSVKAAASHHTASNAEDGVAVAIERILSGEW